MSIVTIVVVVCSSWGSLAADAFEGALAGRALLRLAAATAAD